MTFHIDTITQCSGGGHVTMSGTINGAPRTVDFLSSELTLELPQDDWRVAAIQRMRSQVKESGAQTPGQAKAALEGKTFQV